MAEPEHLSGHHRRTLEHVFAHPTSRNLEWREVTALLADVSDSEQDLGAESHWTIGDATLDLARPRGDHALTVEEVVRVRTFLEAAGYR